MTTTFLHSSQTKWKLCVIFQEDKAKSLKILSKTKQQDMGSGYSSLADNLTKFHDLGLLGTIKLKRHDEAMALKGPWLQIMFNIIIHASKNTTTQNCEEQKKKTLKTESESQDIASPKKRSKSHSCPSSIEYMTKEVCFSVDNLLGLKIFLKQLHFK